MKNEKRNYVVVGAFVIAMVVVLVVWVSLMAGRGGATDRYTVLYTNVSGLKAGTRILYQGYPVGLIDSIFPVDRNGHRMFQIELDVEKGWPISVDSKARIATGIFSAPVIDIDGGGAQEFLTPGSEIAAQEATNIVATLNTTAAKVENILNEVGASAPELIQNAKQLLVKVNAAVGRVNEILQPDNVRHVSSILENLDQATLGTNRLLVELGSVGNNMNLLITHLDGLLDEESGVLQQALADAQHSLATVAQHIDAITSDLEDTTRNLAEFSQQLRQNPGVLLRGRETADDGDRSR